MATSNLGARRLLYFWIVAAVVSAVGTEVLRGIVHKRRERRTGHGGSQDVGMWGLIVTLVCITGAIATIAAMLVDTDHELE